MKIRHYIIAPTVRPCANCNGATVTSPCNCIPFAAVKNRRRCIRKWYPDVSFQADGYSSIRTQSADALVSVIEIRWIHRRIAERHENDAQMANRWDSDK
jgi:hypothetical protein